MEEKKVVLRGDVYGDDYAHACGAKRFAFDLTPDSMDRLWRMRQALRSANRDYELDLCSVTSIASMDLCDIYDRRRSDQCRWMIECLELVVMQDCFHWQFTLGGKKVYETDMVEFADAERLMRRWDK